MKRASLLLAILLVACATQESVESDLAAAAETCRSLGYREGTDAMRQCVERVYRANRQAETERTAATPTPRQPIVPRTPPVPGLMQCHRIGTGACQ